jgi:hypothetical protein
MKKTLLYLTSIMLFSALTINAQKTWTFGDTSVWTTTGIASVSAGGATVLIDQLVCAPHASSTSYFAQQAAGNITYSDGFAGTTILKTNGSGAAVANMPAGRYFSFNVNGPATFKVWFKHGSSSGVDRTLFLTDGTNVVGSQAVAFSATGILNVSIPAAGKYYLYGDNNVSISKMEVIGAVVNTPALANKSFQKELDITVYAKQNKIFLSNLKSKTQVNVYNVLGSLVKTAQVDADSSLDINSGVYIVNAKSAEGEKSVKVIVQ